MGSGHRCLSKFPGNRTAPRLGSPGRWGLKCSSNILPAHNGRLTMRITLVPGEPGFKPRGCSLLSRQVGPSQGQLSSAPRPGPFTGASQTWQLKEAAGPGPGIPLPPPGPKGRRDGVSDPEAQVGAAPALELSTRVGVRSRRQLWLKTGILQDL